MSLALSLLRRQWFLASLALVLIVGIGWHGRIATVTHDFPRGWLVATVMFLTALPLPMREFLAMRRRWRPYLLALSINVLLAPLAALGLRFLLPTSLGLGLVIAASVPCTLASAAVWTRRGRGNDALALSVTVVTNLACFVVMPAIFGLLLSTSITLPFTPVELSQDLALRVLLPVALAQLLRSFRVVANLAAARRSLLAACCQIGILTMVLMGAVEAGETLAGIEDASYTTASFASLAVIVAALHLALFAAGWWGSLMLAAERRDRVAVAVSGSQKTLMIGLDVAMQFGGLAVLPMVAYHVAQLLLDTVLVDRIRESRPVEPDSQCISH